MQDDLKKLKGSLNKNVVNGLTEINGTISNTWTSNEADIVTNAINQFNQLVKAIKGS